MLYQFFNIQRHTQGQTDTISKKMKSATQTMFVPSLPFLYLIINVVYLASPKIFESLKRVSGSSSKIRFFFGQRTNNGALGIVPF